MYNVIKTVIESKDFELRDILYKISKMYVENRITEEQKNELDNMARLEAKTENSYDIQKQIDNLRVRIEALENKDVPTDEPTEPVEEYPEFVQPTGAHDTYNVGDKVTFNNKKYTCILDNCVWSPDTYPAGWEEVVENAEV